MGKWVDRIREYQEYGEGPPLPSFLVTMIGDLESRLERLEGTAKGEGESDLSRLLDVNRPPQPKVELVHELTPGHISARYVKRKTVGWVLKGDGQFVRRDSNVWGRTDSAKKALIFDSAEAARAWMVHTGFKSLRVVRLVSWG